MKKIFLVLSLSLLLTNCSSNSSSNENFVYINKDFKTQLKNMKKSIGEKSYLSYLKCLEYLDEVSYSFNDILKNSKTYQVSMNNYDDVSKQIHQEYWKNHDQFIIALKETLQKAENYNFYRKKIENVDYYLGFNDSSLFNSTSYQNIDGENIVNKINKLRLEIEKEEKDYQEIKSQFQDFYYDLNLLNSANGITYLYQNIYSDDEKYIRDYQALSNYYVVCNDLYNQLLKTIHNSKYFKNFRTDLGLTSKDIEYIKNYQMMSEEQISLLNQENTLLNSFSIAGVNNPDFDYRQNYLELINIRKQIAEEFNYPSYLDYIWEEKFDRDYKVEDATKLANEIINNQEIKSLCDLYLERYSLYSENVINTSLDENDIFMMLENCQNIFPKAKEVVLDLKTKGNYNFEARSNKHSGSFVSSYTNSGDFFLFLSGENNASRYITAVHEFGHYLGFTQSDSNLRTKNRSNVDVCEVHSQSLEYLMTNYYSLILDDDLASTLIDNQKYSALWNMLSGACIYLFEHYVYTTDELLTIESLDEKCNEFLAVMNEEGLHYSNVPHIYLQPGYYISYVTSLIPSLEIWNMELEEGKKVYRKLINYGTNNSFNYIIDRVGLSDPFEEETLNNIISNMRI
ncbi:MAG: hypothetical protein E7180_02620 [Erysipelotrichaceae bacterium]|nr:hypothetical protein [Erysipelotrichaceae bacterium]